MSDDDRATLRLCADLALRLEMDDVALSVHPDVRPHEADTKNPAPTHERRVPHSLNTTPPKLRMTDLKRKYVLKQTEQSLHTDMLRRLQTRRPERVDFFIRRGLRVAEAYHAERAERRLMVLDYLHHAHGLSEGEQQERQQIGAYLDRLGAEGTHE